MSDCDSPQRNDGSCFLCDGCEACELLEQRNRKLKREVDSLSEEQRRLSEALGAHERLCPIMHCCTASSSVSGAMQP
ncbi:basic leucine zipper transcriptional factor ATF-like 3 isoform X2 [Clinocottus analis]|uniref:basic leucine zipper transcriptional factor ATF-like 3 isoform X2 n=1 Tax=Clinocottus analis TaxID=304258 RepID=UPI0035C0F3DF